LTDHAPGETVPITGLLEAWWAFVCIVWTKNDPERAKQINSTLSIGPITAIAAIFFCVATDFAAGAAVMVALPEWVTAKVHFYGFFVSLICMAGAQFLVSAPVLAGLWLALRALKRKV